MSNTIAKSFLFDDKKNIDDAGVEFWYARDLMLLLDYTKWQNFETVLKKAKQACLTSGHPIGNHFTDVSKMVLGGYDTVREIRDWKLDRYACYLIAQNGDPNKPAIAQAQTYFAIQTRKQEILDQLSIDQKRLYIRSEVSTSNKQLFSTAKEVGVKNFGYFNDAGYKGLYNKPLSDIERQKGVKKGELLDRAGTTELAANLFRITQTDEKLKKDKIKGEKSAANTHRVVGKKVRDAIKEIGGTMPEDLPTEKHIKEIDKKDTNVLI